VWESVKESIAEIERRRVVALCCTAVNRLPRCAQNAFFHVTVVGVCCFVVAVAVAVAAAAATTKNIFHEIALLCTQTTNRLALGT